MKIISCCPSPPACAAARNATYPLTVTYPVTVTYPLTVIPAQAGIQLRR